MGKLQNTYKSQLENHDFSGKLAGMELSFKTIGLRTIGTIESCFKEKFGIPRQPRLASAAKAILRFDPYLNAREAREMIRGLEGFSHIWVIFCFHGLGHSACKPLVRPPRLGGAEKVGVFASRSPHRPNPIGISAVALEEIRFNPSTSAPELHLNGVDLLDGTPVLDIKPYIPYSDSIPDAKTGWVGDQEIHRIPVEFSEEARSFCERAGTQGYPSLQTLLSQVLELDPRPAFQARTDDVGQYAMKILDFDVHWEIRGDRCMVVRIIECDGSL